MGPGRAPGQGADLPAQVGLVGVPRRVRHLRLRGPGAEQGQRPLEPQDPPQGAGAVPERVEGATVQLSFPEPDVPGDGGHRPAAAHSGPYRDGDRVGRPAGGGAGPGQLVQAVARVRVRARPLGEAAHLGAGPQSGQVHPPVAQLVRRYAEERGRRAGGEPQPPEGSAEVLARNLAGGVRAGVRAGHQQPPAGPQQVHATVGQHHGAGPVGAPQHGARHQRGRSLLVHGARLRPRPAPVAAGNPGSAPPGRLLSACAAGSGSPRAAGTSTSARGTPRASPRPRRPRTPPRPAPARRRRGR